MSDDLKLFSKTDDYIIHTRPAVITTCRYCGEQFITETIRAARREVAEHLAVAHHVSDGPVREDPEGPSSLDH